MAIDFVQIISNKDKSPVQKKWQEIYNIMAVHTQGICPVDIFVQRRPMESDNPSILTYRKDNHRPITKDEFDKAISDYIATAVNLDVTFDYQGSQVKEYESTIKMADGMKSSSLKEWWLRKIGAYSQTDPNAMVVVLPKHTSQPFIPDYTQPLPDFNTIMNQKIDVDIRLVTSSSIVYVDYENLVFRAGMYRYGSKQDEVKEYYIAINKQETLLIVPYKKDKKVLYKKLTYYLNKLKRFPSVVIGRKLIIEQYEDGSLLEYYVSDYHGAAAWGDLALGQGSDLRLCEVRYVYPRHWRIKVDCDNSEQGCHYENGHYVTDAGESCPRCKGLGYIMDTSPMGTMLIKKGGVLLTNDGKFQEPEGFIVPPGEILKHSADRESFYFDKMQGALCIMQQNMTAQSGESKKYDVSHKVDKNTMIVTDQYLGYENLLNIIDEYRGGKGGVKVSFPEDFDVRNANDILYEMTEAKKSGAPYVILVELTKKFLLKTFGDGLENEFIINFLAKADRLFAYGLDDLQTVKSIFGSDIKQKDILRHTQGYQIMKQLLKDKNQEYLKMPYEELSKILDAEIDKLIEPVNTEVV